MKFLSIISILTTLLLTSCIGDDFVDDRVDPVLRIANAIDSIAIDSSYKFEMTYLNNVGKEEEIEAEWSSSNEEIIEITIEGVATALNTGSADIFVEYADADGTLLDSHLVSVGERTVIEEATERKGKVSTTSSYKLSGSFTLSANEEGDLDLVFADDYEASTALPGLFIYLSNNPNTISEALELQAVEIFEGAHTYNIADVGIDDYRYVLYFCKPFNVKVGHGEIEEE